MPVDPTTPIEIRMRTVIDELISTGEMHTSNDYNFDWDAAGFDVTVSADEEVNIDDGDEERFEGLGIPENRRVMKAGIYRNNLLVTIETTGFLDGGDDAEAALLKATRIADDWKKAFGTNPSLKDSGVFEVQYKGYDKIFNTDSPPKTETVRLRVLVRYRQDRKEPLQAR